MSNPSSVTWRQRASQVQWCCPGHTERTLRAQERFESVLTDELKAAASTFISQADFDAANAWQHVVAVTDAPSVQSGLSVSVIETLIDASGGQDFESSTSLHLGASSLQRSLCSLLDDVRLAKL